MYRQTLFYGTSQMLCFLHIEGKTLHMQNDYDSFYCDIPFLAMIWNRTCNISEICL